MNYRHDLLRWRVQDLDKTYEELAKRHPVSSTSICDLARGEVDPRASTIKAVFKAMGLDPKYAMDFTLRKSDFRRAVLEVDVTAR